MIAAHFGRERSTVIRWAADRGMPVHRVPGKGRGSVFALTEELDAWLADDRPDATATTSTDAPSVPLSPTKPKRRKLWLAAAIGGALTIAAGAYAWRTPEPDLPRQTVPTDAANASLYLEARSDWAQRTPAAIAAAIGKLEKVIAAEPGFAPAYAALADSYILAREFGSLPDLDAFARAQAAIDTGLRIDPRHPDLLRAKGFLDYWWRGDRAEARASFEASLANAPQSAQTHFWYGNVLIDNGDFAAGLEHFDRARLLQPGSPAIEADLAWAQWSAGKDDTAKQALLALGKRHPSLAVVPDYLSVMRLAEGDSEGFVELFDAMARIRREPSLTAYAKDLRMKLDEGSAVLSRYMIDEALAEAERGERTILAWPAFVASSAGDRARLIEILDKAISRKEAWGSAGLRDRIARQWQGDTAIVARLDRLQSRPMVPQVR